ncbi:MAG: NAD-dependent epimerase/dehydratase family protein [Candidatus Sedimenticola endophacoides]
MQDRVSRLVFASSSEVYGEPAANPVDESVPTQGKTIYAVTKLAGEEMCKAYAQRYPFLQYTILRSLTAMESEAKAVSPR